MTLLIKHDRTAPIEYLQGFAFLLMAIGLSIFSLNTPDSNHYVFWVSILTMFSILQLTQVFCKDDLYFLRLVMTWVSGMVWLWVAYQALRSVIAMPVFCIAMSNLYAFTKLGYHISEHIEFLAEKKQDDSSIPTTTY